MFLSQVKTAGSLPSSSLLNVLSDPAPLQAAAKDIDITELVHHVEAPCSRIDQAPVFRGRCLCLAADARLNAPVINGERAERELDSIRSSSHLSIQIAEPGR